MLKVVTARRLKELGRNYKAIRREAYIRGSADATGSDFGLVRELLHGLRCKAESSLPIRPRRRHAHRDADVRRGVDQAVEGEDVVAFL